MSQQYAITVGTIAVNKSESRSLFIRKSNNRLHMGHYNFFDNEFSLFTRRFIMGYCQRK